MRAVSEALQTAQNQATRYPISRIDVYETMPVWTQTSLTHSNYPAQGALVDGSRYSADDSVIFYAYTSSSGIHLKKFGAGASYDKLIVTTGSALNQRVSIYDGYLYYIEQSNLYLIRATLEAVFNDTPSSTPLCSVPAGCCAIAAVNSNTVYILRKMDFTSFLRGETIKVYELYRLSSGILTLLTQIEVDDDTNNHTYFDAELLSDGSEIIMLSTTASCTPEIYIYRNGVLGDKRDMIPIDIVDNYSYLRIGHIKQYDGVLYATGELGRAGSTGLYPQSMAVVLRSRDGEHWTLDRHRYLGQTPFSSPLLVAGKVIYGIGEIVQIMYIFDEPRGNQIGIVNEGEQFTVTGFYYQPKIVNGTMLWFQILHPTMNRVWVLGVVELYGGPTTTFCNIIENEECIPEITVLSPPWPDYITNTNQLITINSSGLKTSPPTTVLNCGLNIVAETSIANDIEGWNMNCGGHGQVGTLDVTLNDRELQYSGGLLHPGQQLKLYAGYRTAEGDLLTLMGTFVLTTYTKQLSAGSGTLLLKCREWAGAMLADTIFDQDWQWLSRTRHFDDCDQMDGLYSLSGGVLSVVSVDQTESGNIPVDALSDSSGIVRLETKGKNVVIASTSPFEADDGIISVHFDIDSEQSYEDGGRKVLGGGAGVAFISDKDDYLTFRRHIVSNKLSCGNDKINTFLSTLTIAQKASHEVLAVKRFNKTTAIVSNVASAGIVSDTPYVLGDGRRTNTFGLTAYHATDTTLYVKMSCEVGYAWLEPLTNYAFSIRTMPTTPLSSRFYDESPALSVFDLGLLNGRAATIDSTTTRIVFGETGGVNRRKRSVLYDCRPRGSDVDPIFVSIDPVFTESSCTLTISECGVLFSGMLDPVIVVVEASRMFHSKITNVSNPGNGTGVINFYPRTGVGTNPVLAIFIISSVLIAPKYEGDINYLSMTISGGISFRAFQAFDMVHDKTLLWTLMDVASKAGIIDFGYSSADTGRRQLYTYTGSGTVDAGKHGNAVWQIALTRALTTGEVLEARLGYNVSTGMRVLIKQSGTIEIYYVDSTGSHLRRSMPWTVTGRNFTIAKQGRFVTVMVEDSLQAAYAFYQLSSTDAYSNTIEGSGYVRFILPCTGTITRDDLDQLIGSEETAGVIADQGNTAQSAIQSVIRDGRIKVLPMANGGLRIDRYATRANLGILTDCIAMSVSPNDRIPTHVRTVGAEIGEYFNHQAASQYGVMFYTAKMESLDEEAAHTEAIRISNEALSYADGYSIVAPAKLEWEIEDEITVAITSSEGHVVDGDYVVSELSYSFGPAQLEGQARLRKLYE